MLQKVRNNAVLEVGIIFLIMVLFFFKFHIVDNEMDVLPYARAFYNPNWLQTDWYLHLHIPYRFLFSYPVGWGVETFGWVPTMVVGRLISYLTIAIAFWKVRKCLFPKHPFSTYLVLILLYILLFRFGMGPGEWIVGGLDTKVFAYAFVILSFTQLLNNRLTASLAFGGLALSFHLLVGGYHLICLLPLVLIKMSSGTWTIQTLIKSAFFFAVAGGVGLYAVADQLLFGPEYDSIPAWAFYVERRVDHHVLPSQFPLLWWILMLFFTVLNITLDLRAKSDLIKNIAVYNVGTVALAAVGLIIWVWGETHLLRFYFFRFSDGLLPFFSIMAAALFLFEKKTITLPLKVGLKNLWGPILIAILIVPAAYQFIEQSRWNADEFLWAKSADREMAEWIKQNTPTDRVFLTHTSQKYWYMHFERPVFATYKNAPQSAPDIDEWVNRLAYLNKGTDPRNQGLVYQNFMALNKGDIIDLQSEYPRVEFALMPFNKVLDYPILYRTNKFILYDLRSEP